MVGDLSAAGTAGALFGTFVTGFVLISALPTRPIVLGLGATLVVVGGWFSFRAKGGAPSVAVLIVLAVSLGAGGRQSV